MRHMQLTDGLKIRFPGRDPEFDEGFEVGVVAALMSLGVPSVVKSVSINTMDQIAAMAAKLGYHVSDERYPEDSDASDMVELTLLKGRARPKLRMIHNVSEPRKLQAAQ